MAVRKTEQELRVEAQEEGRGVEMAIWSHIPAGGL